MIFYPFQHSILTIFCWTIINWLVYWFQFLFKFFCLNYWMNVIGIEMRWTFYTQGRLENLTFWFLFSFIDFFWLIYSCWYSFFNNFLFLQVNPLSRFHLKDAKLIFLLPNPLYHWANHFRQVYLWFYATWEFLLTEV